MKRRDAKLQSDAQRLRQRHPPSASLSGREEGEGRWGREERGKGGGGGKGRGGRRGDIYSLDGGKGGASCP